MEILSVISILIVTTSNVLAIGRPLATTDMAKNNAATNPCGDWTLYKSESCFKVYQDNMFDYEVAKTFCKAQSRTAALLQIQNQEQQEFYSKHLFDDLELVDYVWLGVERRNDTNQFVWPDGDGLDDYVMTYANWAEGNPTPIDDKIIREIHCVKYSKYQSSN